MPDREWSMVIGMVLGAFGMPAQAQNLVQNGVTLPPPQGVVTVPTMQPLTLLLLALGVGAVGWAILRR
ncbi:hypothetical protein OS187_03560 [Xanthomonadaceae bacterium JHOS43]|nr:hypothetical protein [Xanthomonadaceae bacterium JHOS43]